MCFFLMLKYFCINNGDRKEVFLYVFFSGAGLGNPWGDFFHITLTHPLDKLGGVDYLFGFLIFGILKLPTIGHN